MSRPRVFGLKPTRGSSSIEPQESFWSTMQAVVRVDQERRFCGLRMNSVTGLAIRIK